MPRIITFNRCPHDTCMIAVEDRSGDGSKRLIGGSGHSCTWSEVWRYGFLPAEFAAKLLEFEDRDELPTGAIVQVIEPAADGTVGMVGMIGIVVPFEDGEVCDIPDAGGVPVYFNWPDDGLHGRIARSRLRVVGMTSFVPVGPWKHGGVVTVENDRIVRKDEARGVAGDRCESGNECGRTGCPECQQ